MLQESETVVALGTPVLEIADPRGERDDDQLALDLARENNMPADNIKRAIQKGTGTKDGVGVEKIDDRTFRIHGIDSAPHIPAMMT